MCYRFCDFQKSENISQKSDFQFSSFWCFWFEWPWTLSCRHLYLGYSYCVTQFYPRLQFVPFVFITVCFIVIYYFLFLVGYLEVSCIYQCRLHFRLFYLHRNLSCMYVSVEDFLTDAPRGIWDFILLLYWHSMHCCRILLQFIFIFIYICFVDFVLHITIIAVDR